MSESYTKLMSSIVQSTVWSESLATKVVWITMLALSDRKGYVGSSVPGLAKTAGVTVEQCEEALVRLHAPDSHSRTKEHEGRRVGTVERGWLILNYEAHRNRMDAESVKESKRLWWNTHRGKNSTLDTTRETRSHSIQAAPEADAVNSKEKNIVGLKPDLKALRKEATELLTFLNEKTKRFYQPVPANIDMIVARLKEGNTPEDCRAVVAKKCREWGNDEKMNIYLRPATLFGRLKFAQYRGEVGNG